VNIKFA
jgi:8a0101: efflux pump membrane protein